MYLLKQRRFEQDIPCLSALIGILCIFLVACGSSGGGGDDNAPDTTPHPFGFNSAETTLQDTWIESNIATLVGFNAPAAISITNGEYRVDNGDYTADPSTVTMGQPVQVRVRSSSTLGESVTATLTVGGVSGSFQVTTIQSGSILTRLSNASCTAPDHANTGNSSLTLEPVFPSLPGLSAPIGLFQVPNDPSMWYVVQQNGVVRQFENSESVNSYTDFLDLTSRVTYGGERGLLGFAFHPNFAVNGEFYVSYNDLNSNSVISRFTYSGTLPVSLATEEIVLTLDQPATNHNGGHIGFGPDGYLYIGFGDGGGGGDPFGHGQNTQSLHSTILRIDVNNSDTYTVPADNPFVNNANVLDEIYAYGLRNPWRWSFDQQNGDLWLGDVGQGAYEEVDIVAAGDNLGWPIMEGAHCYNANSCDQTGLVLPVAEYNHDNGDCSITGGYVYRGQTIPALQGHYLYGDFCTGRIWSTVRESNQSFSTQEILLSGLGISSFAQDHSGEVYVLSLWGDPGQNIFRFVDSGGGQSNIPETLSQTGCFSSTNDKTYSSGVVSFDVIAKLWSDGVDKSRLFAVPDSAEITVEEDGDFEFPEGSILIKNFILDGQYLETRLFMRHVSGWGGYSYKWLEDQSDATLVEGADSVIVDGFEHLIPSRGQCFECHTTGAGISLGPEASQMNHNFTYPNGNTGNQLTALFDATYLSSMPAGEQIYQLVDVDNTQATISERARSYLHSNCSGCHRPGGTAPQMDFRIQTSINNSMACDQIPNNGDLGINNARIIAPGDSARSVLLARMQALDNNRMPPLATQIIDQTATNIIEQWIDNLTGCQ
ncbi:MAG: PQQ-dependent sugar dehydrogenase [Kangiellaceae bacterium]|nr:PQQ-dependent sugar dehydrogenase [Kangiellaceae bacterium]